MDLVGALQGDVLDQQSGDPLALAGGGGGVGPQLGEVGGERADAGLVLFGERGLGGGAGAVVVVSGALDGAQRVVPVGFEGVGDQAVCGVDGEVAPARELGALPGAFDVAAAQLVGLVGAGFKLGFDRERDVQGERGDGVQQEPADGFVDAGSGQVQADWSVALDVLADALVVGHQLAAALVVWTNEIHSAGNVPREEWDEFWAWLEEERIATPEDRPEFDRHFTHTQRQTASPRPGLQLARRWPLAEAEALDSRGALHAQVREALNAALIAFGKPPLGS